MQATLKTGEFLVLQDAAEEFHWNNSQATLHLFVAYYRDLGEVRHPSYVVISDCLHYDTIAVHLFQKLSLKVRCQLYWHPKNKIYFLHQNTKTDEKKSGISVTT